MAYKPQILTTAYGGTGVTNPGTSGNVLTSNGTSWASALPFIQTASVTLTSAQIKALHGTPIQIIAAPGVGKGIIIVNSTAKFTYGGSNVFVAAAGQAISTYYNNGANNINSQIPNGSLVGTNTTFSTNVPAVFNNVVSGVIDNVNVVAINHTATEITGNAANDNTIDIQIAYYIVTF
jgi:hypothetical protein